MACKVQDDPYLAAQHLGHALHALGDWYAHGDWAKGRKDNLTHHGDPKVGGNELYDDQNYDAAGPVLWVPGWKTAGFGSGKIKYPAVTRGDDSGTTPVYPLAEGRPNQVFWKWIRRFRRTKYEEARWPMWKLGRQRIQGTEKKTRSTLDGFLRRICAECNDDVCPKCQCFFIAFGANGRGKFCGP